jgi:hypothetical protein
MGGEVCDSAEQNRRDSECMKMAQKSFSERWVKRVQQGRQKLNQLSER